MQTGGYLRIVALVRKLDGVLHDMIPRHVCRINTVLLRLPLSLGNAVRL